MTDEIKSRFYEIGFEVADHTSAMLAYWDKNLVCRYANAAYFEWFGKLPEEMVDKITLSQLLGPLFGMNLPFIKGVLEGKVQVFERDIKTPSGEIKSTIATYCPDFENEQVKGFFVHVADVTPLKKQGKKPSSITDSDHNLLYNEQLITGVHETLKAHILKKFPGISVLAKQHFISETKLKTNFKAKYNTTIFAYYRELQMEFAHKYLNEKKCSKKQIANLLNFSNQANFSLCYNRYLGQQKTKQVIVELQKQNENLHKTFTEQVPFAMAMLDTNLNYLAYSQKWLQYFKAADNTVLLVNTLNKNSESWQRVLNNCLAGATFSTDEEAVDCVDGKQLWIKWDIRPWFQQNDLIGGVIIAADDVSVIKQRDIENKKLLDILNKTNEITRTGAWKRNFDTGTAIWSKILKEILEVPPDFEPTVELAFNFYKEGTDREMVKLALHNALTYGTPFDIEAHLISARGNLKKVRVIGYPEFSDGVCHKLSGIFQELCVVNTTII